MKKIYRDYISCFGTVVKKTDKTVWVEENGDWVAGPPVRKFKIFVDCQGKEYIKLPVFDGVVECYL